MRTASRAMLLSVDGFGLATAPPGRTAPPATEVLDKAIKALGGEEKLAKPMRPPEGQGHDQARKRQRTRSAGDAPSRASTTSASHFEGEFDGNKFKGVTVLNGDKGWRKFGDQNQEMEPDAVKNEKRTVYLMVVPATILPLKSKDFKVEAAAEER